LPSEPTVLEPFTLLVHALLWIAAAITLWTGAQYWHKAHVAVGDD
jgi:CDP-diacylglycerol--glycerol-3-phosphate 3-phosphatidyltransferase